MRKSKLQEQFARELRAIQSELKRLESMGIIYKPEDIEPITRKRTRLKKSDIEELKGWRKELQELYKPPRAKAFEEPLKGRRLTNPEEYIPHPKELLTEEEKKERRNYRARVRRLEKQGYDTSQLKRGNELTTDELKSLKRGELAKKATKNGETAYDIRNREANEKRQKTIEQNKRLRERVQEVYKQVPTQEPLALRPRELGDYIDVGRGALAMNYHDPSIIETLLRIFQEQENAWGAPLEDHKNRLVGVFYDIINENDVGDDGLLKYEDYLRSIKKEVMALSQKIYYDSKEEQINNDYINLIALINHGVATDEQKKIMSDVNEYGEYDIT